MAFPQVEGFGDAKGTLIPVEEFLEDRAVLRLDFRQPLHQHFHDLRCIIEKVCMLCNDDEWRAEVYFCASDRQQAAIVFDVAVDMVKQSPALSRRIKIIPSTKRMVFQPTGSIYQVLSSEVATKHGLHTAQQRGQ